MEAHDFSAWTKVDDTTHSRTCSKCKKTGETANYTETANHNWQWVAVTPATPNADESVTILITIGAATVKVNGKEIKLDSPAFIENDRTYTPIRFISENLGASVEWVEKDQKVIITKPEIKKAETK